jgi:glycosyltransferase involved in cell wall biosynthesis
MTARRFRIHDKTRTGSLELVKTLTPAVFLYRRRNYDFDEQLAMDVGAHQAGRLRTAWRIARERPDIVELNEPAMIEAWPSTLLYTAVILLLNWLPGRKIAVVTYAIENGDVARSLSSYSRLPLPVSSFLVARVMAFLALPITRMAFGSDGARTVYASLLPRSASAAIASRTFMELPKPCDQCEPAKEHAVAFVGSFEERKGVHKLLDAWAEPALARSGARLSVLGKGPLEHVVRARAGTLPNVDVTVDPAREVIHRVLANAKVLVLFSQPTARWREQIGRPIMEGLAHGCEIVASTETGLADWLGRQGHRVLDPGATSSDLASAIGAALRSARSPDAVTKALPRQNQRVSADSWLMLGGNATSLDGSEQEAIVQEPGQQVSRFR